MIGGASLNEEGRRRRYREYKEEGERVSRERRSFRELGSSETTTDRTNENPVLLV
jgi:hypothetical protein